MKFFIENTKEVKTVTLRCWKNNNWSPDFFGDVETLFSTTHSFVDGGDEYLCTQDEFNDLVKWWEEEVRAMNEKSIGQNGADYSQSSSNEEYNLEVL